MYHSFFIHSSVDGHLGYFHVLAIVNAAVTLVEKEMAPHSSVLVWRIPWTEKPGGLQSMGLHRVRDDWSDLAAAAAAAAVTLGYMYLFQLWFYQGICPVVGLLSHMVVLFLVAFKLIVSILLCYYKHLRQCIFFSNVNVISNKSVIPKKGICSSPLINIYDNFP